MTNISAFRYAFLSVFLTGLVFGQPQSVIIPHIADGGGWQTTIVLTNTTISTGSASFTFYQETSAGATQSWSVPFVETVGQNVQVAGGDTVFLHTAGTSPSTSTGWAQIIVSSGIVGYAIFTQRIPGRADQDGTSPGGSTSGRILVPFDNTVGCVTGVALANPSTTSETVSVNIKIETGAVSQTTISIPAQGHLAFVLSDQIPATAGHRGLAEFSTTAVRGTGSLSAIALRFNPTGAFTSAPVYGQSGAAIIGVTPPSGGTK
jgi:hypothetical protein